MDRVKLYFNSTLPHFSQLITGLQYLHEKNKIELKYQLELNRYPVHIFKIDYNGLSLFFDMSDNSGIDWKIYEESEKAKVRAKQTVVTVTAGDMWRERQILAQAREEAKAAGLLETPDEEDNEGAGQKKEEKKLEETLAVDPYVQLSLALFTSAPKQSSSTGTGR